MKKSTRRAFLGACLGAGQLALLDRYGLFDRAPARAQDPLAGPTKLLTIFVNGGLHWEHFVSPFRDDRIATHLPGADAYPFYSPATLRNWDGSAGDGGGLSRPIRGPAWWSEVDPSQNAANSSERHPSGRAFDPKGYAWVSPEHRLFENTVFVHGVDQQTAAHESGIVASTCGIAGANFASPAVQAIVANHFDQFFPDRVIPNAVIGRMRAPALSLPASAGPKTINTLSDMQWTLSDRPGNWDGLRTRTEVSQPRFGGEMAEPTRLTHAERRTLASIRGHRGESSSGTDAALEQLYDSYLGLGRALATDVLTTMENTPGFEYLPEHHPSWMPREALLGWRIGYADAVAGGMPWRDDFDLALRFLKTGLSSSVSVRMQGLSQFNFDTHYSNPFDVHANNLFGVMESIGQVLIEMKNTPSPDRAGRSLLDDTLVYIYSDFGRTFRGSDHNPMTSALLVGGGIAGNQMIGGFDEGPLGVPVAIREEDGREIMRAPKSQDTIATILTALGLEMGDDFFLPGGYGEVVGVRAA